MTASIGIHIPRAIVCWNDAYVWQSTVDKGSCKVENGELVYTNFNTTGVETKLVTGQNYDGRPKPFILQYGVYRTASGTSPLETSGESLQNGLLYDIHGKRLPIDQAAFGFRWKSAAVSYVSLKCSKKGTYVGYVKIGVMHVSTASLTTRVLKIKFKFD